MTHESTMTQHPLAGTLPAAPWFRSLWWTLALLALLAVGLSGAARAQDAVFKDEELDQMLAPIALYPDSLLAQILMASTYPTDVAEAVAWSKAHPDEKGDAAITKVEAMAWEPAVKSLAAFPQVLAMMGAKPEDVQRLGDAFLADPARLMDRVQGLRNKAQQAGNLKTTEQQKVSTQTAESKQVIVIEPAQPESVYVPVYQPSVYGAWGYPAYPPYYWAPPPYYYPGAAFVGGVLWGAAIVGIANGLWGGCNWGGGNVNINVNKFNNVNVNNRISNNNNNFNHNSDRRGNVPYRDSKSREQFGNKQLDGAKDRESNRGKEGRDTAGGRDAQRNNASATLADRGADPAAGRDKLQGADRDRANAAANQSNRGTAASSRDSALSGARDPGASRADADRGSASRNSMNQRSAPTQRAAPAQRSAPAGRGGGGGGGRGGGGGGRR